MRYPGAVRISLWRCARNRRHDATKKLSGRGAALNVPYQGGFVAPQILARCHTRDASLTTTLRVDPLDQSDHVAAPRSVAVAAGGQPAQVNEAILDRLGQVDLGEVPLERVPPPFGLGGR